MTQVEWDEKKRLKVLSERGVDFREAAVALLRDERLVCRRSNRQDEEYYVGLVEIKGEIWAAVHLWRGETLRIVTVRPSRRGERRAYRDLYP